MQIDRLVKMIFLLIKHEHITTQQIADYFDVSKRTILRDINTLSLAGIPIYTSKGNGGGVGILKEYTIDKTFLSQKEQDEIIHALQVFQATKISSAEQVLNKISVLFKNKSKPNWIEVDFSFFGSEENEKIKFNNIEEAILNKHVIQFDYFTSELQYCHRIVEPLRLLFRAQAWYIQGYCRFKNDIRFFRTSRMKNLKITDEFFGREIPEDLSTEPDYSKSYDLQLFKLKFAPEIAHRIYDEYNERCVEICEDNSFLVSYYYPINEWVVRHILSFGRYVEVLEPESARDLIKERAKEIIAIYE